MSVSIILVYIATTVALASICGHVLVYVRRSKCDSMLKRPLVSIMGISTILFTGTAIAAGVVERISAM